MKTDIAILHRSFGLIFADPLQTLKVTAPGAALVAASTVVGGPEMLGLPSSDPAQTPLSTLLVVLMLGLMGMLLIAVCWHRYALLEGAARAAVMRPGTGVLIAYFIRLLVVGLVLFAAALPGGIVIGLVSAVFSAGSLSASFGIGVVLGIAVGVILSWVALRISLTLPAAALGRSLKTSESWRATAPLSDGIFRVAVILAVMQAVLAGMATGLVGISLGLAIFGQILLTYFQILLSISVLSTLYGHLIEGRDLT